MNARKAVIAVVTILAMLVMAVGASATPLPSSPPAIDMTAVGLSIAEAGVGFGGDTGSRNVFPQQINISIGGPVVRAVLYWGGFDQPVDPALPRPSSLLFDSHTVTGVLVGTESLPAGDMAYAYAADVTAYVTGSGSYQIDRDPLDAPLPWPTVRRLHGAGLLVLYIDESDSTAYQVVAFDGADYAWKGNPSGTDPRMTTPVTFDYGSAGSDRTADLVIFGGGGEAGRPDVVDISDNATQVDVFDSGDGDQWDTDVFNITIPAGVGTTTVEAISDNATGDASPAWGDSFFWVLGALRIPVPVASLGDYVWEDLDVDGIQDAGEPGIPGVTVNLYDCAGNPVASTSTDSNGYYLFDGLTPGDYYVEFVAPAGYVFSPQDQGADDALDSDADPSTGLAACTTLDAGEHDLTWDAGLYMPTSPGTGTPGYWMNHPEAWPVDEITIGGVTYSKADAIANMMAPVAGDKTYTMFPALVAAKLNVLIGNDDSCISDTIAAADAWMATYGAVGSGVPASSEAWDVGEPLYEMLDDYNNGELCAPSRDALETD